MRDFDSFFQQARSLRLAPDEFRDARGALASMMHRDGEELPKTAKSDILLTLHSFATQFPLRSRVPTSDHDSSFLSLWRGTNLFRHLQPFLI